MSTNIVVYLIIHAFIVTYMVMMGAYMLFSKRSAFAENCNPDNSMRRIAGLNVLLWAVTFIISFHTFWTNSTVYEEQAYDIVSMLDFMVVPAVAYMFVNFLQLQYNWTKHFIYHLVIPILNIVIYCFHPSEWVMQAMYYYWFMYVVCIASMYLYFERKYIRRVNECFSEIDHKELLWIRWAFVGLMLYFIAYIMGHLMDMQFVLYLSYAWCVCLWTWICLRVEMQEVLPNLWADDDEMSAQTEVQDERTLWLEAQMKLLLEEQQLYLQSDLTIEKLAAEIGTNRTYVSQYVSSLGHTYYSYINTFRVEHAKRLIAESVSSVTLTDIAMRSGFRSDATFRRVFRDLEGISPTEYKRKVFAPLARF